MKNVCIRSYSHLYFPVFGLNMERYGVSLHIQYKYGKMRTRITPNTDTFYAGLILDVNVKYLQSLKYCQQIVRTSIVFIQENVIDTDMNDRTFIFIFS